MHKEEIRHNKMQSENVGLYSGPPATSNETDKLEEDVYHNIMGWGSKAYTRQSLDSLLGFSSVDVPQLIRPLTWTLAE